MNPFFDRRAAFEMVTAGYHGKRLIAKLTFKEVNFALTFIMQKAHLSPGDFESAVNRTFVDDPELRFLMPNWAVIMELLSMANTASRNQS